LLDIVKFPTNGNGHAGTISGRGLARRKLSREQRISLAADLACGRQHLDPSLTQVAALLGVTVVQIRDELKARSTADADLEAARWFAQCEAEVANAEADAIVTEWTSASPVARDAAIRILGPATVWDVIVPVVV
jgi:hypothetical protein